MRRVAERGNERQAGRAKSTSDRGAAACFWRRAAVDRSRPGRGRPARPAGARRTSRTWRTWPRRRNAASLPAAAPRARKARRGGLAASKTAYSPAIHTHNTRSRRLRLGIVWPRCLSYEHSHFHGVSSKCSILSKNCYIRENHFLLIIEAIHAIG